MTIDTEELGLINRREAIRRVSALLGGVAFVGGTSLISACEKAPSSEAAKGTPGAFTPEEIAYLDEVAETILPETKTPGAKAAKTGAFMALMVTDSYGTDDQKIFRDGMAKLEDATKKAHNVGFMAATPEQRLAVLNALDREQKTYTDARENAQRAKRGLPAVPAGGSAPGDEHLPDQRKEGATGGESSGAAAITADAPSHYFRMMKELALLGYFTSEIGYTKAMRYQESPGRFDPCTPYTKGEPAWAPHA
jgi:hypothetical protein